MRFSILPLHNGNVIVFFRKISKTQFNKMKNDQLDYEPFVECDECGRKMHQICVLHFEAIWPNG